MAELPKERVEVSAPFTYCGIDCFGPFITKKARKEQKRYGLIFTCLASRSVHIEMLEDLSTDAFINALRCFISLRGAVRQLHCDHGTNFVGARNEFKEALKQCDIKTIESFLTERQCEFIFNAPSASHAGGVWERQIRTVRSVLNATHCQYSGRLDNSSLRTLFYEAMAITEAIMRTFLSGVICVTLLILSSFVESQSERFQVVGPEAPLVAVAGEDLVLPCFLKPSTSAVDMTVEWLRLEKVTSLVHFYQDHEERNEKQAQPYRGRTSLFKEELQKGNASLKLSPLRVSDEGSYKCLVEDKLWYDDITVHITVEAQGSHPVIMMESYDHSGGINLVCESRGWKPEPEVVWLDREGAVLPAEDTQTHRDTEGFSVKSHITVYDYSDSNRYYCRLLQKHHMMETEVIINRKVFDTWRWVVGVSVSACLIAVGLIVTAVICYKKELQRKRSEEERDELQDEKRFTDHQTVS
ncbi:butyrophilin subfamily 1 member A1-like [Neoarius graeffei]|uniref:butyrophilin subfamily 1 member A1-like n=1 Tax=Neoarius graeffei TaxID=443677 RepID=UPI00298BDE36|nr:butyrophilin subfamily 1 member A1-like [Neoarius graeffei]